MRGEVSNNLKSEDNTNDKEDELSSEGGVSMTELVELEEYQNSNEKHEGGVKLKVGRGWANVIDTA